MLSRETIDAVLEALMQTEPMQWLTGQMAKEKADKEAAARRPAPRRPAAPLHKLPPEREGPTLSPLTGRQVSDEVRDYCLAAFDRGDAVTYEQGLATVMDFYERRRPQPAPGHFPRSKKLYALEEQLEELQRTRYSLEHSPGIMQGRKDVADRALELCERERARGNNMSFAAALSQCSV